MQTTEFFDLIQSQGDKAVQFRDHLGNLIPPAYHVSEVKAASYQTVDCGEMLHDWEETILQLWLSPEADAERGMTAGKIKGILAKVSQKIGLFPDAEVRVEYGSADFPPILFHIENAMIEARGLTITLRAPVTTCKLEDRGGSCARPEVKTTEGDCCSGSGCC